MSEAKNGIVVDIYGNEYVIKGNDDPEYIKEIAKYVDEKMRKVAIETSNVSTLKVSILTSLNLAEECCNLRKENENYKKCLNKVEDMVKVMEDNKI
jgi:cell division protein ZapA